jgi:mannosyltransferase
MEKFKFLAKERPFLLFVGSRRPNSRVSHEKSYKRFNLAVQALRTLNDFDLVVVGGEPWGAEDQDLVNRCNATNQVFVIGAVSEELLPLFYSSAHALLYLSDYEGFGLPVLEASQCCCPVIAQNKSSIPEVHGDPNFLLSLPDPDLVAEKVRALENELVRRATIEKGLGHAAKFGWDKTWAQTNEIYRELTGS